MERAAGSVCMRQVIVCDDRAAATLAVDFPARVSDLYAIFWQFFFVLPTVTKLQCYKRLYMGKD
jgi:hypothetical protein